MTSETFEMHAPNEHDAREAARHSLFLSGFYAKRVHASNPRLCRVTGHPYDCFAYTVTAEGEQLSPTEHAMREGDR